MTQPWFRTYRIEHPQVARLPLLARALLGQMMTLSDDYGVAYIAINKPAPAAIAMALGSAERSCRAALRKHLPDMLEVGAVVIEADGRMTFPLHRKSFERRPSLPGRQGFRASSERLPDQFETTSEPVPNELGTTSEPVRDELRTSSERVRDDFGTSSEPVPNEFETTLGRVPNEFDDVSTRNHTRARKTREDKTREEEIPPSPPTVIGRWKLFEAKWRAAFGSAGLGLCDERRKLDIRRIEADYPELDFATEVDAFLAYLAASDWTPDSPWILFRKHVGAWQQKAAAAKAKSERPRRPGPAEPSPPEDFVGDTKESIEAKFARFREERGGVEPDPLFGATA